MPRLSIRILFHVPQIFGAIRPEDQDKQVTEHRNHKGMLHAKLIRQEALENRNDRAA